MDYINYVTSISLFGKDLNLFNLILLFLFILILIWAIHKINQMLKNTFIVIKILWSDIKDKEKKIEKNLKDEDKKEVIEKSLHRIIDSDNLLIIGRYILFNITGFLLLITVVVIAALILVLKT